MKLSRYLVIASLATLAFPLAANAAAGSVKILAPVDNAMLDADEEYPLNYEITLGAGDDHFHVWVDDKKSPAQRTVKGTYTLPKLSPGKHAIYIKIVDKGHTPTGPEQTIHVTTK
jgi:hypothetical protein